MKPARHARIAALVLVGSTGLLAMFGGCRQILSIEERQFDPALADGGTSDADSGPTPTPLTCDAYCDLIQSLCVKDSSQYGSKDACIGLCSTFPEGTLDDKSGNTLGCRIHELESNKAMIEQSACAAAGPGGAGKCGTNCDSYCKSILTVCPGTFDSEQDCMTVCTPLIECAPYYVAEGVTPDNPSIQCRLYHMSVASIGILNKMDGMPTDAEITHCPHALGKTECVDKPDPMCPP